MILYSLFLSIFFLTSLILCAVIMMQEGKSGGLGTAFMGGESQDSLFGVSTAQVIKKFTAWMIGIFLFLCTLLSFWTASIGSAAQ